MADPLAQSSDDPLMRQAEPMMRQMADTSRAAMAERRADIAGLERTQADEAAFAARPPQTQPTPQAPKSTIGQDANMWVMAASVIGALAGRKSPQGTQTLAALNAFTGTLNGLTEGNKEKFEQNVTAWKAQAQKVMQDNQRMIDDYDRVLKAKQINSQQKLQQIQLKAQLYQDDIAMQRANLGDLLTIGRLNDARQKSQDQMQQAWKKIEATVEAAKIRAQGNEESQEAIDSRVAMSLAGNPQGARGLKAGSPTEAKYQQSLAKAMQEQGVNQEELIRRQQLYAGGLSGARSYGTREANLEGAIRKMDATIPIALEASAAVPRGPIMRFNEAQQYIQSQAGDPKLRYFLMINFELSEALARVQKPTGVLDVELQKNIFDKLTTAQSKGSYIATVKAVHEGAMREMQATRAGYEGKPIQDYDITPEGKIVPKSGAASSSGSTSTGIQWSVVE